jgi:SAM-dependent methyltransferase
VRGGVKEIWASDISPKLIELAQKYENPGNKINYLTCDARDFEKIPKNYFDLVFMNMAIHYIDLTSLNKFIEDISAALNSGGRFVFTTEHPLRKLAMMDAKKEKGPTLERVLNSAKDYLLVKERIDHNAWTGEEDLKIFHAPIGHYVDLLAKHNLFVDILVEPVTQIALDDVNNPIPVSSNIPIIFALRARKL